MAPDKAKYYIRLRPGTTDRNMLGLQRRNCAYFNVADDLVHHGRFTMDTRGILPHAVMGVLAFLLVASGT